MTMLEQRLWKPVYFESVNMFKNLYQKAIVNEFLFSWGISILAILVGVAVGLLGGWALGGAVIGIGIGWGVSKWQVKRTLTRPLERLISLSEASLVQDSLAFTDALVALAQGDLTTRVKLVSQPISFSGSPELNRLTEVFNSVIVSLQGSANEFNNVTDEPCQRLFYVGADPYLEGRTCGELMGQALGGRGSVIVISGFLTQTSQELRRKGFESLLREKYPDIRMLDPIETLSKIDLAYTLTKDLLQGSRVPEGIYVVDGGCPPGVARAVVDGGLSGKIILITHDLVDATMEYVSKGVITATLGQDPYAQGYDTAVHLFNYLVTGWRPSTPRLITARDVVTQANYRQYWKAGLGMIESKDNQDRRAKPLRASPRPLRIAVVGREESAFWEPVKAGVLAAAQSLREYNATIDWIVPEADKTLNIDKRGPFLEKLIEQGYHAVASDIPHQRLIPFINKIAAKGIAVATFNGEPNSLRGLMSMLDNRAKSLLSVSQDLANSARNLGGSGQGDLKEDQEEGLAKHSIVQAITKAVREVTRDAQEQAQAAGLVSAAVGQIARAIDDVASRISDVSSAATLSVQTAKEGTDSVNQTLQQMQRIHEAVGTTAKTIQDMSTYSQQIGNILFTLEDFANQSNLLALNGSIVAAGASEAGLGFSMVVKEMRRLAEQSAQATKEVGTIVQTVQKSIGRATDSMLTAINLVKESSELAASSGQAMNQLLASAVDMQKQTLPLVDANKSVRNAITQLNEANMRVAQVITENLAATKQISTTTDGLVSQTQAVSGSAVSLNEIARELEGATAMFQIENGSK
jgi:methyl-accepting chemotaxis protein